MGIGIGQKVMILAKDENAKQEFEKLIPDKYKDHVDYRVTGEIVAL